MTTCCMRACGLNSLVDYFHVNPRDIGEGGGRCNLIWESLVPRVWDIREGVTVQRVSVY
jgi:hypothetical protein